MTPVDMTADLAANPVDTVEYIAELHDWMFERTGIDEITIAIAGGHTEYHVSFTWMENLEALHLASAFDFKVPERRRAEILELLARINEQLWIGHFDLWAKQGIVLFRQTLVLAGGAQASSNQVETLLKTAVETCERFYPAFQFVVWAGRSASESLDAVLLETLGEA